MTVERRDSPRMPVGLDVVLNHRNQAVVCSLKNISMNGACIDAEPELLPYNGSVELGFSVPINGESKQFRVPATIRWMAESGAGLSFGDIGREAYFSLVDLYAGN